MVREFVDRIRGIRRRQGPESGGPASGDISNLPCSECGAPASEWEYRTSEVDGSLVIDGVALCATHAATSERTATG